MTNLCKWVSQGKKKKKEVLCWIKTPLEEWAFGLVCWVEFTDDGSEGKIVQCCLGGSGGRHELLGGPHGPGRNFKFLWARKDFCRCENFRLQGCRVPLLSCPKAVYSPDRVIFEPISNYLLCSSPCLVCHSHSFTCLVMSLGFVSCMRWCQACIGDESFIT